METTVVLEATAFEKEFFYGLCGAVWLILTLLDLAGAKWHLRPDYKVLPHTRVRRWQLRNMVMELMLTVSLFGLSQFHDGSPALYAVLWALIPLAVILMWLNNRRIDKEAAEEQDRYIAELEAKRAEKLAIEITMRKEREAKEVLRRFGILEG